MAKKDYVYAVARIRVLEKNLLNDGFIEQLVLQPDVASVQRVLSERGWDEDLTKEEEKIRETLSSLGVDPEEFSILNLPDSFHNLKAGIKDVITRESHPRAYYDGVEPSMEMLNKILSEKDFSALPEYMQKAAEEAYTAFVQTLDGQLLDILVDRYCLEAIFEEGEKSEESVIRDYAETTVAVTDMKIAARCALTGKPKEFADKALAACRTLDKEELSKAAASGMDKLMEYLKKTKYQEASEALKNSFSEFERWCDNTMIRTMKVQKTEPFSIGPLFAYMIGRKNEIKTVRVILTGKENDLSQDAIRERVRQMYG